MVSKICNRLGVSTFSPILLRVNTKFIRVGDILLDFIGNTFSNQKLKQNIVDLTKIQNGDLRHRNPKSNWEYFGKY